MRFSKHILTVISEARNCRPLLTAGFFAGLLVVNVLAWRGWSIEEASRLVPLRCPLFLLTGIQCPTCGLGRSVAAAAIGEGRLSFYHHPLGIPILTTACLLAVALWLCPKRISVFAAKTSSFFKSRPRLVWIFALLYAMWGFFR